VTNISTKSFRSATLALSFLIASCASQASTAEQPTPTQSVAEAPTAAVAPSDQPTDLATRVAKLCDGSTAQEVDGLAAVATEYVRSKGGTTEPTELLSRMEIGLSSTRSNCQGSAMAIAAFIVMEQQD
jgi:hypothetical protein